MYSCTPKIVIEKNSNLAESFDYLQRVPGLILVKNAQSEFCAMSNHFSHLLGFQNSDKYVGKSEYDVPCEINDVAEMFVRNDRHVIETGSESLCMIVGNFSQGRNILISKTKPIYDQSGSVIGVFAHTKDMTKSDVLKRHINLIVNDHEITGKSKNQTIYTLNSHQLSCMLTSRQQECLFLMVRGKSVKEIAYVIGVSPRTVEDHVDALRVKLECTTWPQMIDKAMAHDFLSFMSESFL